MLCSLILYSLNNVVQYYTLSFLELRNTYNILSARSAVKKSSMYNDSNLIREEVFNLIFYSFSFLKSKTLILFFLL